MAYRQTARTASRLEQTRERILACAQELIAVGGYRSATVAAVAGRAGVATGSVYSHFPSKASLFAEVFRRASQREVDATSAAARRCDGDAAEKVAAGVEEFARRALRGRRLAWALLAEPVDPAVETERLRFRRAYRDAFAGLLAAGVAAGELPAQNVELIAAALVGALGEALVGPLAPIAEVRDQDVLIGELRDFCIRSITNQERVNGNRRGP